MVRGSETTEKNDVICISAANKKFVSLAKNIYASETFYTKIDNLKCMYVSIYGNKVFVLLLHDWISTLLNLISKLPPLQSVMHCCCQPVPISPPQSLS